MFMNSVSVVTICYNARTDLEKTMRSVLQQHDVDMEYIIQDGGSNDGSLEFLEQMKAEFSCPVKIVSGKDGGIYDAMNRAADRCTKDWVIFMNAGDTFADSDVLQKLFAGDLSEYDVLYGDAVIHDKSGRRLWKGNLEQIRKGMPFCHQTCAMRTSLVQKLKFNTGYRVAADYDMVLRAYNAGSRFRNSGLTIAVFCTDGVSSTKYVLREKEKVTVMMANGMLPANFRHTPRYPLRLGYAKAKEIFDRMISGSPVEAKLRYFYMKHIKHYQDL